MFSVVSVSAVQQQNHNLKVRFSVVIYFLFLVSFSVLNCSQLDRVIFCVFLKSDKELYETMLPAYFPRGLSSHTLVGFSCFIGTYRVSFILNTLYTLSPKINPHRELSAFLHLLKRYKLFSLWGPQMSSFTSFFTIQHISHTPL